MIITKLEVKGGDKRTAEVDFRAGLNVVAGASDTGKSYICQSLQFILGAENPPKPVEESEGYSSVEVSFADDNGGDFILKRELKKGSDITVVESGGSETTRILKPNHRGAGNVSEFFLERIGLEGKTLVTGTKSLNHASLTLRVLEKIFLVDESRIIADYSPMGTGQNTERTKELSLLKTLLTGHDDSAVLSMKSRKNSKRSLHTKIESLQEFLTKYLSSESPGDTSVIGLGFSLESAERALGKAEAELESIVSDNNANIEKRREIVSELQVIERQIDDDDTVLERFTLLLDKYASDRERLYASSEAVDSLQNHYVANCPTCGSVLEQEETELDIELVLESNASEARKIKAKVADLNSTIEAIRVQRDDRYARREALRQDKKKLDTLLDEGISNRIRQRNVNVRELSATKAEIRNVLENEKKKVEVLTEIGRLQTEHDEILDTYTIPDFSDALQGFTLVVSEVLTRWGFPDSSAIEFDMGSRDILVGNKPRGHFGKGYRAICFSAFIIGLMSYLSTTKRHPGFVVLDSPLTTYKERDELVSESDEDEQTYIAKNLLYAFYRDLCDFYNDKQIIVLENKEPDKDLTRLMNYIHFSKNKDIGRYGFFPV